MSTLHEVQTAITELSSNNRQALLSWLLAADRAAWDEQISHDFSDGGAGMKLLAKIDKQIDCGDLTVDSLRRSVRS
jgi:hypothetical protein